MGNSDRELSLIELISSTINIDGVSDYYFATGMLPAIRVKKEIKTLGDSLITDTDINSLLKSLTDQASLILQNVPTDFGLTWNGRRFRCNLDKTWQGLDLTMRLLPQTIKTLAELGIPESLYDIVNLKSGLVLVCGPTGSGKSTTLASLLSYINETSRRKIVTIEDPIEYIIENKKSLIHQREITSGESFLQYLRSALRQHPDVIVVGEIRDADTAIMAIQAAETEHLVLSTLHTTSVQQTIMRLYDMIPESHKNNMLSLMSCALKAVIVQKLIRGRGDIVMASYELCIVDDHMGQLIRASKFHQIPNYLQMSPMCISFDKSLESLIKKGYISEEIARLHVT